MPATPARIGFVLEEWRKAISEDGAVRARHGKDARESDDPIPTFFDSVSDAQTMADERQELLGVERRRFRVEVAGLKDGLALPRTGPLIPNVRYTDPRRGVDMRGTVCEIGFDFDKQRTTFMVWGSPD